MKNKNNSSSVFHHRNPQNNNDDECQKHKLFICEFCHKHFTSGQSLGGHKTTHRSNNKHRHHHPHNHKTIKITFSLYSDHTKQNKHSWTRVFHSNMATKPTASTLKPITLNQLPSVANLDFNHPDSKRMKLSGNVNVPEKMQKPFVPLTYDPNIDERHSWTRGLKGIVHHPPTALDPCQQESPAIDLLSLVPPRSYITQKRSRRYLVHVDSLITLLQYHCWICLAHRL